LREAALALLRGEVGEGVAIDGLDREDVDPQTLRLKDRKDPDLIG